MYPTHAENPSHSRNFSTRIYIADAALDAAGLHFRPAALALDSHNRILAVGPPTDVQRTVGSDARLIHMPGSLLIPALVNAHTHLELTAFGPRPYPGDFIPWINSIRATLPQPADLMHDANRRFAVNAAALGARRSLDSGVVAVGDISRFTDVHHSVARSGLQGIGFLEFFGLGPPDDQLPLQLIAQLPQSSPHIPRYRLGIQPHAPYSAGPRLYHAAAQSGLPLSTHLAETTAERSFIHHAQGPFRDVAVQLGKWHDSFADNYPLDQSPVQWLRPHLSQHAGPPWLVAHCNYVDDADIALLAQTNTTVAYCPRASDYYHHTNHRYRDMLDAGLNVALGTDSILCHSTLSIFDEMRHLHRRDHTDPLTLLAMATTHGAKALNLDPALFKFTINSPSPVIALRFKPDTLDKSSTALDALRILLADRHPPAIHRLT